MAMPATGTGYLIPGEAVQGNCYRVFLNDRLYAVVGTSMAAEGLMNMIQNYVSEPQPKMRYELAYIEGIGF